MTADTLWWRRHQHELSSHPSPTSLSSFIFYSSISSSPPSTKPLRHVFRVWKTCNKNKRTGTKKTFQQAEEGSLGYRLWMICSLWLEEGGALVVSGAWWSSADQCSLDAEPTAAFPNSIFKADRRDLSDGLGFAVFWATGRAEERNVDWKKYISLLKDLFLCNLI